MSNRKHNRSPFRWFTTYFVIFSYLIVGLETFSAGIDATHHWYQQLTFDLIIAAFWAGMGVFFTRMAYSDGKLDGDLAGLEAMSEMLDKIAKIEEEKASQPDHQEVMTNTLMEVIDKVTGGKRPPTKAEVPKIEALFHETTGDHYAKLTVEQGGMAVEISSSPISSPKPRKRAPRKPQQQLALPPAPKK